jgi:creatinine amidohydrolase
MPRELHGGAFLPATMGPMKRTALVLVLFALSAAAQERDMARINWMEFRELVPSKITTVLIPTGTLEPHGVANNGADITAPEAMARSIAPKVNAMIAPAVPYGITGSMEAYPGAFQIPEAAYRPLWGQSLIGSSYNELRQHA